MALTLIQEIPWQGEGMATHTARHPVQYRHIITSVIHDLMISDPAELHLAVSEAIGTAAGFLECDQGHMFLCEGSVMKHMTQWARDAASISLIDGNAIPEICLVEMATRLDHGSPLCVGARDATAMPDLMHDFLSSCGLTSIIAAPIMGQSALMGCIFLGLESKDREMSDRDLAFIQSIADAIGAAMMRPSLPATPHQRKLAEDGNQLSSKAFLARMSHELRMPLDGVIGVAEMMQLEMQNEGHRQMAELISESGRALLGIISDLIDISRIEAGLMTLRRRKIDVHALVRDVAAPHRNRAVDNGVEFTVEFLGHDHTTRAGDDRRFTQILNNVIGNAVKFTDAGEISVTVDCSDPDQIEVKVKDTGVGIDLAAQPHVFTDFFQGSDQMVFSHGGTGLGLPISRRFALMMGGDIRFQSEAGEGSEFFITLGMKPPVGVMHRQTKGKTIDPHQVTLAGKRVLLADDNPSSRIIMTAMLERCSADVVSVSNGAEALEAWNAQNFHLIILDISMPVLDGIEAMKAMHAGYKGWGGNAPPIVAFTAHAMDHQVDAILDAGFDSYVVKPVSHADLASCLAELGFTEPLTMLS